MRMTQPQMPTQEKALPPPITPKLQQHTLSLLLKKTAYTESQIRELFKAYSTICLQQQHIHTSINDLTTDRDLSLNNLNLNHMFKTVKGFDSLALAEKFLSKQRVQSMLQKQGSSFYDCVILLDKLNPEYPFKLLRVFFSLFQDQQQKKVDPQEIISALTPLLKSSEMQPIALTLIESLKFVEEKLDLQKHQMIHFQEYLRGIQDYHPLKQYQ